MNVDFSSNYSVNVDYVPADLSKVEDIEKLCKEVFRIYEDGIDILVNNAGESKFILMLTISVSPS